MQLGCRTLPSPQRSPFVPFYNHTYFPPLPPPEPLSTTNLVSISITSSFQKRYIHGLIQYITFWGWLFSLSVNSPEIHIMCISSSLLVYCWVIFHAMDVLVYLATYQDTQTSPALKVFRYICVSIPSIILEGKKLWKPSSQ